MRGFNAKRIFFVFINFDLFIESYNKFDGESKEIII